jgi:hypothetical protein
LPGTCAGKHPLCTYRTRRGWIEGEVAKVVVEWYGVDVAEVDTRLIDKSGKFANNSLNLVKCAKRKTKSIGLVWTASHAPVVFLVVIKFYQ